MRKWANGAFVRTGRALVTAAAAFSLLSLPFGQAVGRKPGAAPARELGGGPGSFKPIRDPALVPLPQPRPPGAPKPEAPAARNEATQPGGKSEEVPAAPEPSACRAALTEDIAVAPSVPPIHGSGGCGGDDLVRLEAIVLPDRHRVSVNPPAVLRCPMAAVISDWIRTDMAPLAAKLGSEISELDNFASFECRSRNRVAGAILSEHGRANALDVRGFKLAGGQSIGLTDPGVSREFRESVLHSACARFSTVLGPGSDSYHEDHIHLDLMQRRNNYKICQWDVLDALPPIAPLLPQPRPEQAPPRQIAAQPEAAKSGDEAAAAAKGARGKPDAARTESRQGRAEPNRQDRRRRRQSRHFWSL
jgi:hypothetical protein